MERRTLGSWFGLKGLSITVLLLSGAGLAVAEQIIGSGIDMYASPYLVEDVVRSEIEGPTLLNLA